MNKFKDFSGTVINAAMKVHSVLGVGLFENIYQACLIHELQKLGVACQSEVPIPIYYDTMKLDIGFRLDILVENSLIVELKSVEIIKPIHKAQLITYLKLAKKEVGLLINFNSIHLRDGLTRVVNTITSRETTLRY